MWFRNKYIIQLWFWIQVKYLCFTFVKWVFFEFCPFNGQFFACVLMAKSYSKLDLFLFYIFGVSENCSLSPTLVYAYGGRVGLYLLGRIRKGNVERLISLQFVNNFMSSIMLLKPQSKSVLKH